MDRLDIQIPQSWGECSERQLRYLYRLQVAGYTGDAMKILALARLANLRIHRAGGSDFLIIAKAGRAVISAERIASLVSALDWLDGTDTPVRFSKLRGHAALPADFSGVPFETFLICENIFQAAIAANDENAVDALACSLYNCRLITLRDYERVMVLHWFAAIKALFARTFPDLFKPAGGDVADMQPLSERLRLSADAQIRALTKGDITKEKEILALDTWRALTELNAQAKEYEEYRNKVKK
ncbi:MAG: hypothetical protein ACI30W_01710 [Muribaculaceae bacterium]